MKKDLYKVKEAYESPRLSEVRIASEGILCESGSIDSYEWVEDEDGWN